MAIRPRRSSSFLRNRSSVYVVQDTRGVPLQWISYGLCLIYVLFGIRDGFFCDKSLTNDEKEIQMFADNFAGCTNRPIEYSYWGLNGTFFFLLAAIRFAAARAKSTSDFFHAITFVAINDILIVIVVFGMGAGQGSDDLTAPMWYYIAAGSAAFYQIYVSRVAFRAYRSRLVLKDLEPSEKALAKLRGPGYKAISLLICSALFAFAIRDFFFCGMGFDQAEQALGMELCLKGCYTNSFWQSWMQNVGVSQFSMAMLRAFAAFGATNLESFLPALTYQLFLADLGILVCLIRAEANVFYLLAWAVLAIGYDGYVWYAANTAANILEDAENEKKD